MDHYSGWLYAIEHSALYDCSESRGELVSVERKWQVLEHLPKVASRHYVSVPLHLAAEQFVRANAVSAEPVATATYQARL